MYRFVVLFFGVIVAGVHAKRGPDGIPACMRVAHRPTAEHNTSQGGLDCCKKEITKEQPTDKDNIKECFQLNKNPPNCDVQVCIAKKLGLASDDGTINKSAMLASVEKQYENDPDLVESLKENCINGDLSKYGPSDMCDLMKQNHCLDVEIVKSCNEWNDEGDCSEMKELATECIKQFA